MGGGRIGTWESIYSRRFPASIVRSPSAGKVARKTAGRDQNGVEPDIEMEKFGMPRAEGLGGANDAPALFGANRQGRHVQIRARLDLDERQRASPANDQVHFARAGSGAERETAGEHAVPLKAEQEPGGEFAQASQAGRIF